MNTKKSLYVLKCENYYKVGVALDPFKRIKHIAVTNPFPLSLVKIYTGIKDTYELERRVHRSLKDYHHKGEWFTCNIEIIEKEIEKTIKELNGKIKIQKINNKNNKIIKRCSICNIIIIPTNNRQKYCIECWKKLNRQRNTDLNRIYRQRKKENNES